MRSLLLITSLLLSISSHATVKIAVLDTGFNKTKESVPLCEGLSKSFVNKDSDQIEDVNGHGTNVVNIIHQTIKLSNLTNYCFIIYKVMHKDSMNPDIIAKALDKAVEDGADIVNLSLSGRGSYDSERIAIEKVLNSNIQVVSAIGNDGANLSHRCEVYPACYDPRIIKVGAFKYDGERLTSSNYAPKENLYFTALGQSVCGGGKCLSGSSQATAKLTGLNVITILTYEKRQKKNEKN